jgi:hypothetical protein
MFHVPTARVTLIPQYRWVLDESNTNRKSSSFKSTYQTKKDNIIGGLCFWMNEWIFLLIDSLAISESS